MNQTFSRLPLFTKIVSILACVVVLAFLVFFVQNYLTKKNTPVNSRMPALTEEQKALIIENMRTAVAPTLTKEEKKDIKEELQSTPVQTLTDAQKAALIEKLRSGQ